MFIIAKNERYRKKEQEKEKEHDGHGRLLRNETKQSETLELGGIKRTDGKCSITVKLCGRSRERDTRTRYLARTGKFSRRERSRDFPGPGDGDRQRNGFVDFAG